VGIPAVLSKLNQNSKARGGEGSFSQLTSAYCLPKKYEVHETLYDDTFSKFHQTQLVFVSFP